MKNKKSIFDELKVLFSGAEDFTEVVKQGRKAGITIFLAKSDLSQLEDIYGKDSKESREIMGNASVPNNAAIYDLARLALTGDRDDIAMYIKRLAYRHRNDDGEFSDRLTALLPEGSFNVLRDATGERKNEISGVIKKSHDGALRNFRTIFGIEVNEGDELEILDGWAPYSKGVVIGFSPHGIILVQDRFGVDHEVYADGYDRNTDLRTVWPITPNRKGEIMSRYPIEDLVNAPEPRNDGHDLVDIRGHSWEEWQETGIIGWDDNLQTYFLNVDFHPYDHQDIVMWHFGKNFREISSPYMLIALIKRLFSEKDTNLFATFKDMIFIEEMIQKLILDRTKLINIEYGGIQNQSNLSEVLCWFSGEDESWKTGEVTHTYFSDRYVSQNYTEIDKDEY